MAAKYTFQKYLDGEISPEAYKNSLLLKTLVLFMMMTIGAFFSFLSIIQLSPFFRSQNLNLRKSLQEQKTIPSEQKIIENQYIPEKASDIQKRTEWIDTLPLWQVALLVSLFFSFTAGLWYYLSSWKFAKIIIPLQGKEHHHDQTIVTKKRWRLPVQRYVRGEISLREFLEIIHRNSLKGCIAVIIILLLCAAFFSFLYLQNAPGSFNERVENFQRVIPAVIFFCIWAGTVLFSQTLYMNLHSGLKKTIEKRQEADDIFFQAKNRQ